MQRRCSRALGLSHLSIPIADMHVTETIPLLSPPSHFINVENNPVLWSMGVQVYGGLGAWDFVTHELWKTKAVSSILAC